MKNKKYLNNICLLIFFTLFNLIFGMSIILPFKKISINNFLNDSTKKINDAISFNIYTNITIGLPRQTVANFFNPLEEFYTFQYISLPNSENQTINISEIMQNKENFWFDINKSISLRKNDSDENLYHELFYFNFFNLTDLIQVEDFSFLIMPKSKEDKFKCGQIGLSPPELYYDDLYKRINYNFINQLKSKRVIDGYSWSIEYEENNGIFNYDDNKFLGKIIVGELPHEYRPDIYNVSEKITIYSDSEYINGFWILKIDEVKSNISGHNYLEKEKMMKFDILTEFIKGSINYQNITEQKFFSSLINKNICKKEIFIENKNQNEYDIYSCDDSKEVRENIKKFPDLIFEKKSYEFDFIFTNDELFKLVNNRWYFMIIFEKKAVYKTIWTMGGIFLRKYHATFDIDTKALIFYKNQIIDVNKKSQNKKDSSNDKDEENGSFNFNVRIFIEIIMGLIILILAGILTYKLLQKTRKKRANELVDNDYEYSPEKEGNEGNELYDDTDVSKKK